MQIIKYLQLPFYFDAALLKKEVNNLNANNWLAHYQKLHYQGKWCAIPLRSIDGKNDNIFISPNANPIYNNTSFLNQCPYITNVLSTFKCKLNAVRLLKLNTGAVIKEHTDAELCFENGEIRLHIPVCTHTDVEFYLQQEKMYLKEGECWYMNFNLPHHINNNSNINRVHLVIDAVVNDWVKNLFTSNKIIVKKEIPNPLNNIDDKVKKEMILRFREMNTATTNKLADELEK